MSDSTSVTNLLRSTGEMRTSSRWRVRSREDLTSRSRSGPERFDPVRRGPRSARTRSRTRFVVSSQPAWLRRGRAGAVGAAVDSTGAGLTGSARGGRAAGAGFSTEAGAGAGGRGRGGRGFWGGGGGGGGARGGGGGGGGGGGRPGSGSGLPRRRLLGFAPLG